MNKPFSDIQLLIKFTIQLTFMKELRMYFYNNTNNLKKKKYWEYKLGYKTIKMKFTISSKAEIFCTKENKRHGSSLY